MSDKIYVSGNGATGVSVIGSVTSAILSAALNHSFWWGVLHFIFGWFYVIYAVICRGPEIVPALKAMFGA